MGLDITKKWSAELALSPDAQSLPIDSQHVEGCLAELTETFPETTYSLTE